MKCRALSTICNQIQTALAVLKLRNGRELATMLYERMAGMKLTMDYTPVGRGVVSLCLLCVFSISLMHEHGEMRRGHRTRIESVVRTRRLE